MGGRAKGTLLGMLGYLDIMVLALFSLFRLRGFFGDEQYKLRDSRVNSTKAY